MVNRNNRFLLIGLTGRTGAGCTTVSDILSKQDMKELDLRSYKTCDFNSSDERKYSVVYRYMKEGNRWKGFTVIEASSVIFSFILQGTYGKLFNFLDTLSPNGEIKEIDKLKKEIVSVFGVDVAEEGFEINKIKDEIIDKEISKIIEDEMKDISEEEELKKIDLGIKYFTDEVKKKKEIFRDKIKNCVIEETVKKKDGESEKKIYNLYTKFMQTVGNNIRSSGIYDNNEEIAGKEIIVAERINYIVKLINRYEELINKGNEKTRICIDALRNSVEIQFFRDRYRAFYSFAVNTDDMYRQNRFGMNEYELNKELFDEVMNNTNKLLQEKEVKEKKAGKCYSYCFKDVYNGITGKTNQVHTRALHAEENAFLQISKYGGAKIQGGKLFTTASPCELCAKKAYQLGIKEIYYIDPYPGISKSHILTFGKTGNPNMIFFQGAIGNAYISLYAPRMPYKDEIKLVTGVSLKEEAEKVFKKHKDDK